MQVGDTVTLSEQVGEHNSTDRGGGVRVYATPMMVSLVERTGVQYITQFLPPTQGSVGTRVEVSHLAPSLLGQTVTVKARVTRVDGRRISFAVEVFDELEKVGEGSHDRFVIDYDRTLARLEKKRQDLAALGR